MHIVFVCREYVGSCRGGGIGSYIQEISEAYVKMGHSVTIITASDDTREELEEITDNGIRTIYLKGGDFVVSEVEGNSKLKKFRAIYRFFSYRRRLRKILKGIKNVNIIEVADYGGEALYLMSLKIPIVIRLHTPQSFSRESCSLVHPKWWELHRIIPIRAEKKIFESAKYITACSCHLLEWVKKNYRTDNAFSRVIFNPVKAMANENLLSVNETKGFHLSEKVIFFAGTISETKGVGDLVMACNILRSRGYEIRLKLAGKGGSFQSNLMNEVKKEGWTWIEFLGKLSRDVVFKNYMEADVCCFPSWWENMPMVVLESMSLGSIVISTDSGGTSEIINDGLNGFLCERKNVSSLADTIQLVLELPENTKDQIRARARQTIEEHFSLEKISSEMLEFFEEVIEDFKTSYK